MPKKSTSSTQSSKTGSQIKLKKGQTVNDLIIQARQIVEEKLGAYKEASICITNIEDLLKFFANTPDDAVIGIDTETTGLNTFTDELVGISLHNSSTNQAAYIPINHKSAIYKTKVPGQIEENKIREVFGNIFKTKQYRYVYHNAKFDLAVLRTFFGYPVPDPYWDTMLLANLFYQNEDHNLKYLYNKYVAIEDEGVNRFDTLFKGITFDFVPIDVATIYAGKDALMTYELYKYQFKKVNEPDMVGIKYVFENIEMPLLPILEDMQRTGININQQMLNQLYNKYNDRLEKAKAIVYQEIDKYKEEIEKYRLQHYDTKLEDPINLASPLQLSILFYNIIGYKTKEGKGTGVKELQEINSPLTNALLEYRKMEKLIDAFLVALPKQIEPTTGKIHTSLNQYRCCNG